VDGVTVEGRERGAIAVVVSEVFGKLGEARSGRSVGDELEPHGACTVMVKIMSKENHAGVSAVTVAGSSDPAP
jgi:hypothetical protein